MMTTKPETETFEYEVHRLLARYQIPRSAQTPLAAEICRLAKTYLGIVVTAPSGAHKRRYAGGNVVHYFANPLEELSACWRLSRERLQPWRIAEDWEKFLVIELRCQHCVKSHIANSAPPSST